MNEKPNYYAVIPANVRYDKNLKANEKILYGEIAALLDKTGTCYASNNYFARLYKVDPSAISKWISNLEKNDYLEISYIRAGKEIRQRNIKIIGIDKYQKGYCQKSKETEEEEERKYIKENIFELVENNLGRTLSPIETEIIGTWDYEYEIIELAVKEAILHNAKTIKYIDRIIFNWKQNKVETIEDAKKYLDEFSNKVKPRKKEVKEVVNYYKDLDEQY